jgi:hypothetical protein
VKLSDEGETRAWIRDHQGSIQEVTSPDIAGRGGGTEEGALGFDHVAMGGWGP